MPIEHFKKVFDNTLTIKIAYFGMLINEQNLFPGKPKIIKEIKNQLKAGIDNQKLEYYDRQIFKNQAMKDKSLAIDHNMIGYAYAMKENYKEALKHFKTSLRIWPQYDEARKNINLAYQKIQLQN